MKPPLFAAILALTAIPAPGEDGKGKDKTKQGPVEGESALYTLTFPRAGPSSRARAFKAEIQALLSGSRFEPHRDAESSPGD